MGKVCLSKEIEEKIISEEIHMGVHSMKDMPSTRQKVLLFTKIWKREDPRDVLILRTAKHLSELREGAVIATGSKRRAFQLLKLRPDLQIINIRGNVDTRLRKMEEQQLDGIVLAAAGLKRLGMEDVITQYLAPEDMISAPAQGALALEVREDQKELQKMLDVFCDEETMNEVCAERNFLRTNWEAAVILRQVPDVKRQIKGMNYMLCLGMKMEVNRHIRKFVEHALRS